MDRRTTYTFTWPGEKRPIGLALNCHMKDGYLRYYDTIRGHEIEGRIIRDSDDAFEFESSGFMQGVWSFKALTIEDLRQGDGVRVENGDHILQAVKSTADLQEWYRKRFGKDAGLFYPDVLDN